MPLVVPRSLTLAAPKTTALPGTLGTATVRER